MASDVEVAVLSSDGVEVVTRKSPRELLCPRIPTTLTPLEEVVEIRRTPWNGHPRDSKPASCVVKVETWPPGGIVSVDVLPAAAPFKSVISRVTVAVLVVEGLAIAIPVWSSPG